MKKTQCFVSVLLLVVITSTPVFAGCWLEYLFDPFGELGEFLVAHGAIEYMQQLKEEQERPHIRQARWGMTSAQVKKAESAEFVADLELDGLCILKYSTTVCSLDCGLNYYFVNAKLVRVRYTVNEKHSNKNRYIKDYDQLKTALTEKYGEGEEHIFWSKDLFKDDRDQWGLAISIGDLAYYTKWVTPYTDILLVLDGDNYKIWGGVEYYSKELHSLEDALKDKQARGSL